MNAIAMLPEPLTPPECDLTDFGFMPLEVARLRDSAIVDEVTGDEFRAAVLLWCSAWHQIPAGSLPDNDGQLAKFAGYGRVVKEWLKVRTGALRGFIPCADGRLYHGVICEKALESWAEKLKHRAKKAADRERKAGKVPLERAAISTGNENSSAGIPLENALKGQGQGQGQGQGRLPSTPSPIFHQKEEILESSISPEHGNGKPGNGTTTIADPHERLARFQAKLASHLGPRGWEIVASAAERTDPDHDRNLALCKQVAKETMKKGWPRLWFDATPVALEPMPKNARAPHIVVTKTAWPKADLVGILQRREGGAG